MNGLDNKTTNNKNAPCGQPYTLKKINPKPPQNSKTHQNAVKRISKACLHLPITKVLKSRHGLNLTHWRLCFEALFT